ncbi:hypothetical protein N9485_01055 [Luminiphilus sp.]|nr:hypothetical protein [Luminiphilus sp.]
MFRKSMTLKGSKKGFAYEEARFFGLTSQPCHKRQTKISALHRQLATNLYLCNFSVDLIGPWAEVSVKGLKHHASLIEGSDKKFEKRFYGECWVQRRSPWARIDSNTVAPDHDDPPKERSAIGQKATHPHCSVYPQSRGFRG